jgi:uncharacterized protein YndB with AHSA1/START domain
MKKVAIALGVLAVILVAVIALQPSEFAIERETVIAAPPEVIFPHLESPKALDVWSPWLKMDPKIVVKHEGPERGVGASESWEGPEMGVGRLSITGVKPNEEVELSLEFLEPMQATNRAWFTLTPVGDGTLVAWRMEGANHFLAKAASLVMDMDAMVGDTFEKGLADLKALAESDAQKLAEAQAAGVGSTMTLEQMEQELGTPSDSEAVDELLEIPGPPGAGEPAPPVEVR